MSFWARVVLLVVAATLCACISSSQALTPEASKVQYLEGNQEPPCEMLGEISVGHEWFVFDERQPAKSPEDVVVRMRRLAAKMSGNLVVILENKPPGGKCSGFNGRGRVYRCKAATLATLDTQPGSEGGDAASGAQEK